MRLCQKKSFIFLAVLAVMTWYCNFTATFATPQKFRIMLPWGVPAKGLPDPMGDAFRAWGRQYMKDHPATKVEVMMLPWENHWDWIRAQAVAGDLPDVICQRVDQGHGYVLPTPEQETYGKPIFLNLDPYLETPNPYTGIPLAKEYSPAALAKARFNLKHLYFLPICQGMVAFIYNVDLFRAAGIAAAPKTMTQLLADCEKLKAKGVIPIGGPGVAGDQTNMVCLFAQNAADSTLKEWAETITGGDPLRINMKHYLREIADGKVTYRDPRIKKCWELARNLAQYFDPACFNRDYNQVWGPFIAGEYAMLYDWSGRFIWAKSMTAQGGARLRNYGFFANPQVDRKAMGIAKDGYRTLAYGSTWGCTWSIAADVVSRGNLEAALDFMWWWASGAQNEICWNQDKPDAVNGDAPPTCSALNKWRFRNMVRFLNDSYTDSRGSMLLYPNQAAMQKVYQYAKAYELGQIPYREFAANADQIIQSEARVMLEQQ